MWGGGGARCALMLKTLFNEYSGVDINCTRFLSGDLLYSFSSVKSLEGMSFYEKRIITKAVNK